MTKNPKKQKADYINNAMLYDAILKWKESGQERLTEELGKLTMILAKKITNHRNFNRYPDSIKDEMYLESVIAILKGIPKFNTEYKNPFAYLTSCAWNVNVGIIKKYYADNAKEIRYFLENAEVIDITDGATLTVIDQERQFTESKNRKRQEQKELNPKKVNSLPSLF